MNTETRREHCGVSEWKESRDRPRKTREGESQRMHENWESVIGREELWTETMSGGRN